MTVSMTIKGRLILTLVAVVLLSGLCVGVYSYLDQTKQLLHRYETLAEQENRLFTTILEADAEGLRRATAGLSRHEVFRTLLAAGDRARSFLHPEHGPMTAGDIIASLAGHDLHHVVQIEQTLLST